MADSDFESGFDEIYGGVRDNLSGQEGTTGNSSATEHISYTAGDSLRFRFGWPRNITLIKAMAWWKEKTIWDSVNFDFFIVKSSEFYLLSNGQLSGKLTWEVLLV